MVDQEHFLFCTDTADTGLHHALLEHRFQRPDLFEKCSHKVLSTGFTGVFYYVLFTHPLTPRAILCLLIIDTAIRAGKQKL
jgi:hypothetical protein